MNCGPDPHVTDTKALLKTVSGRPHQRMEWIGDAVISAYVRLLLVERYPRARVGALCEAEKLIVSNRLLRHATGKSANEAEIKCGQWLADNRPDLARAYCAFLLTKSPDIMGHLEVLNDLNRIAEHERHASKLRALVRQWNRPSRQGLPSFPPSDNCEP